MKLSFFTIVSMTLLSLSTGVQANINEAIQNKVNAEVVLENQYQAIRSQWFKPTRMSLRLEDKIRALDEEQLSFLLQVLWSEQTTSHVPLTNAFLEFYHYLPSTQQLSQADQVHFLLLGTKVSGDSDLKKKFEQQLYALMAKSDLSKGAVYRLLSNYHQGLSKRQLKSFRNRYQKEADEIKQAENNQVFPTKEEIKELIEFKPELSTFMSGAYQKGLTLFLICRSVRDYACRMIMKNAQGDLVKNEDGTLWSNPSLARSYYNYPSNRTNGHTPAGIYTLDSVMPYANNQPAYGQFRRIIMNFIPKSEGEVLQKELLTERMQKHTWWNQATIARDVGRDLLRIHGTGRVNTEPQATYYPFIPSLGCIKNREGTYDGVTYIDQRHMLDQMMTTLELEPAYENEPSIHGVLYVLEINDEKRPVEIKDIENLLAPEAQEIEPQETLN